MRMHATLLLAAAALAGCAEDPVSTATSIDSPAFAVDQYVDRQRMEYTEVFPVPRGCTGEPVEWTLRQEMVFRTVTDANGGFHGSFHFHDLGSSGVGLVTGTKYRLAQNQVESFQVTGGEGQNGTAIFLRRFISQGDMPNFRVTNTFHYTLDANGRLTAYHDDVSRLCD